MNQGFDPEFAAASDWARLYRANGVQIVPCKNKIPRLKSWKEYQNALVPDAQFEAWYGHGGEFHDSYDMGMLTGTASGNILMIDLDIYKSIAAARWWLSILTVHNNGLELETWKQITGGGGSQMFFLYPPGWKFAVNAKTDINVDIRCQGGFAVLPPTRHASGKAYVWMDGCAPWELPIALAPDWLLEEVEKLIQEHGGGTGGNGAHGQADRKTTCPDCGQALPLRYPCQQQGCPQLVKQGQYDAFGHQIDGRETKMRDLVWGAVVDWYRECPIRPSYAEATTKAGEKYPVYEREVTPRLVDPSKTKTELLDMEDRGPEEFWRKWAHAMNQWDTKVAEEAKKPGKVRDDGYAKAKDQGTDAGDIFPFLDVNQIMDKPDPVWVVDGIINERALGFIFGPPSSLKTFIALDLALSIAARLPHWWDRGISRHGAVVYLCREGTSSFKFRIKAWEIHRKCTARGQPFYLIEHPCNFMDAGDVGKAVATIRAIMAKASVPVAAVMVDTVSRVLPGAEENLQKDMTLFVRACELIQLEFQCIVIGIHHTNKNGGIRGSTVIPGAGDFLLETRRETGQTTGTMMLQKVKDGEDGVEISFKFTKYEGLGTFGDKSSLVVDPSDEPPKHEAGKDWPDIAICREILAEIDQQWWKGLPWCYATNSSRSAMSNIVNRWQLNRAVVKDMLAKWTANGIIEEVERDTKTHVKGYKKLMNV